MNPSGPVLASLGGHAHRETTSDAAGSDREQKKYYIKSSSSGDLDFPSETYTKYIKPGGEIEEKGMP